MKDDWVSYPSNDLDVKGIYEYLGWHFRKAGLSSNCFHYLEVLKNLAENNLEGLRRSKTQDEYEHCEEVCPECGGRVIDSPGGGVNCTMCTWWFCY